MDPRVTRAYTQVAEISAQIAAFIDPIINKLQDEDEEFRETLYYLRSLFCCECFKNFRVCFIQRPFILLQCLLVSVTTMGFISLQ